MKNGVIDGLIPSSYPYAIPIQCAADKTDSSAFLAYAIAETETINGELAGMWNAATVVSSDGGHGLFQITSAPIPPAWADPYQNALWAIQNFILPAWAYWSRQYAGFTGDALVRAIASEFNAGRGLTLAGHDEHQDFGYYTSKQPDIRGNLVQYDVLVLDNYHALLKTGH